MSIQLEIPPAFAPYQSLQNPEIVDRYAQATATLDRRLLELSDAQLDTCFRPEAQIGRWSCRILLGHVADADLVFTHRMRKIVGEDRPILQPWDENAFIDAGLYAGERGGADRPIAGHIAMIHTLRLWTADWLRTLGTADWERVGLHPERGEQSVRVIMNYATWHFDHHVWYLHKKIEKFLGPRAPAASAQPGSAH